MHLVNKLHVLEQSAQEIPYEAFKLNTSKTILSYNNKRNGSLMIAHQMDQTRQIFSNFCVLDGKFSR
jgi:hypothetical protein